MLYSRSAVSFPSVAAHALVHDGAASLQRQLWETFALAFAAEAGELGIACRKFKVFAFINFLVNGQVHRAIQAPPALDDAHCSVTGITASPGDAAGSASSFSQVTGIGDHAGAAPLSVLHEVSVGDDPHAPDCSPSFLQVDLT